MPKVTPKEKKPGRGVERQTIIAKTKEDQKLPSGSYSWWKAQNDKDLCFQTIATANYLQKTQQYRVKGASIFSRIYSGKGLMNYALNSKILDTSNQLPVRRPTMNVTQSCIDTLVSRMTQNKPRPVFLTDAGYYKEQNLAKQLNQFLMGEFYRVKAYDKGRMNLRDSCIFGDGFLKVYRKDNKVELAKRLTTELYADKDDSWYGDPRQLHEFMLSDRDVVSAMWPKARLDIDKASRAYVDGSGESAETITDQIILVESWHKRSGANTDDGRHVIVCSAGVILDEKWDKDNFPFVKMAYNPHSVGYFSQGLAEMLMGTQLGIDTILRTIAEAMNLVGVPRVFIDELSKVLETSLNNNVGTIVKYRGTKPIYEVAPCMPQEMYEHLMRLIQFAYQISGISELSAGSIKPAGLNSGEAQRVYLDNQDMRFASLEDRYSQQYIDLAYLMIDEARDIAEETGEYTTVFPNKDGTREVDLPKAAILKDSYIIQCFDESMLPRDPAGRYAQLSEMLASGEITLEEFRSLQSLPDLNESDKLANALRDRIKSILDDIVENGTDPVADEFLLDPTDLATKIAVQYVNRYTIAKLEDSRLQKIHAFITQIATLKQQATPPPQPMPAQAGAPGTNPNALPAPVPPQAPMSAVSQAA